LWRGRREISKLRDLIKEMGRRGWGWWKITKFWTLIKESGRRRWREVEWLYLEGSDFKSNRINFSNHGEEN